MSIDTFCSTLTFENFNKLTQHEADLFYSISLDALSDYPKNSLAEKVVDYYLQQRIKSPRNDAESTFISIVYVDPIYSLLAKAVINNDKDFMNLFIETSKNKRAVEAYIFNLACRFENLEFATRLLKGRTEEELKNGLFNAISNNKLSIVLILIKSISTSTLGEALVVASSIGNNLAMGQILQRFHTYTTIPGYPDSRYIDDALVEATRGRHESAVKTLLDNGANGSAYDNLALNIAHMDRWEDGIVLLHNYAILPASPQQPTSQQITESRRICGYYEEVFFPEFDVVVGSKIDTGADKSNIQAENIVVHKTDKGNYLTFDFKNTSCRARLLKEAIMSTLLGKIVVFFIKTPIVFGGIKIKIMLTVSLFDTVIGRDTIKKLGFLIDPFRENFIKENIFLREEPRPTISFREPVTFPDLCLNGIKAAFDSGAPRNLLFVSELKIIKKKGKQYVLFIVKNKGKKMVCMEPRFCASGFRCFVSGGLSTQETIEIVTPIVLGTKHWNVRIGLTTKLSIYPLVIGRNGMKNRFYIDVKKKPFIESALKSPENCKCK